MTPQEGNELIEKIFAKYSHTFENPNLGQRFDEVYDVLRIVPKPEWQERYDRVKADLAEMGIHFRF